MFSFLVFVAFYRPCSTAIFASGTWDHTIRIWNETNNYLTNTQTAKNLKSLDYDQFNQQILAGCREKSILVWNIQNNTTRVINTNVSVDAILSLNQTHFVIGSFNTIIFYRLSDGTNFTVVDNFGIISDMKLLREDNLILIATNSSKIIVYDLITYQKIFNALSTTKIASLSCLNRTFIFAQCQNREFCWFSLNSTNRLVVRLRLLYDFSFVAISTNIVNETLVYGLEGTNYIDMWDVKNSRHLYVQLNNQVMSIGIADKRRILFAENDGDLRLADISNFNTIFRYIIPKAIFHLISIDSGEAKTEPTTLKTKTSESTTRLITTPITTTINSSSNFFQTNKELNLTQHKLMSNSFSSHNRNIFDSTTFYYDHERETKNIHEKSNLSTAEVLISKSNHEITSGKLDKNNVLNGSVFNFINRLDNFESESEVNKNHAESTDNQFSTEFEMREKNKISTSYGLKQDLLNSTSKFHTEANAFESTFEKNYVFNKNSTIESIKISNEYLSQVTSVYQLTDSIKDTQNINELSTVQSTEGIILTEKDIFTSTLKEPQTTFKFSENLIFDEKNLHFVLNLITSEVDLNDCLRNCSGNGKCKMVNPSLYSCECFDNYSGSSCQLNTLPCSSNHCRNNATCENNSSDKAYKCECYSESNKTSLYYGQNCENKIDICQNETCSNKGVCHDLDNEKECKCFLGYSGDKCEVESAEMKATKSVITVASIIAIIVIALYFLGIVFMDVSNFICQKTNSKLRNEKRNNSKKNSSVQKIYYIN